MTEKRIFYYQESEFSEGEFVLYWMQQSQRIDYNHALNLSITKANELKLPLIVCFIFTSFPEANIRHYHFMYQGIVELKNRFTELNINFITLTGNPVTEVLVIAKKAKFLYMDMGYLKIQRYWRNEIIKSVKCSACIVESDVVVPVKTAYHKEAWSAGVFRPKISLYIESFLNEEHIPELLNKEKLFDNQLDTWLILKEKLSLSEDVKISSDFSGGESAALKRLNLFIKTKLTDYAGKRNDPSLNIQSNLSPYLHFGQISPVKIALEILKSKDIPNTNAFLEELIIRRELAMNFVYFNNDYDNYTCLPDWAKKTLAKHSDNYREYEYDLSAFEQAKTHDSAWNSAQKEMLLTGKMHNYMRMYWGKKIIEWTDSPEKAYEIALYLNNKYQLDGRDANSFAGIAWCFGKHDRAWSHRSIFGSVRYMNYEGLKRKFDINKYIEKYEK